MSAPLPAYAAMVERGELSPDRAQREAAAALERLAAAVEDYDPTPKGFFRKRRPDPPEGLYLWGGVGAGKSLLMDLFMARVAVERKRRVHFHGFMQEVHDFIGRWRKLPQVEREHHPSRREGAALDDPVPHAAAHVFAGARLFCFDEMQVGDITDATLLGRLFEELFALGTVIVATSNRHPDDLYKDGLNRELFLPAIETIKQNMEVREVIADRDYRLERQDQKEVWFTPLGPKTRRAMDDAFDRLTGGAETGPLTLGGERRAVEIPAASDRVARASFAHWCSHRFGPGDYLRIAERFEVVMIDDIPLLTPDQRNEAKRFVTLIDAIYEARGRLVASAAASPDDLYPEGHGAFEFQRTASRLHEMRSAAYLGEEDAAEAE